MGEITNILNQINSSEDNIQDLYSVFKRANVSSLPIIRIFLPPGTSFIRQRINEKDRDFSSISDLTYPPADKVTKYGRANIPYNPLFYCCTFKKNGDRMQIPRLVALLETSEFAKDNESSGIERSTCSTWTSNKELSLIALPFSNSYLRPCDDILKINQTWENNVTYNNLDKEALELVEYMSDEIAKHYKNSEEYFKIAHFIYYLMRINPQTKDADGIIYPSVPAEGEGFNVVLKPEISDRHLDFYNASLCHLAKKQGEKRFITLNHAVVNDGEINYIDDIQNKKAQQEWFNELADGLEFRN